MTRSRATPDQPDEPVNAHGVLEILAVEIVLTVPEG